MREVEASTQQVDHLAKVIHSHPCEGKVLDPVNGAIPEFEPILQTELALSKEPALLDILPRCVKGGSHDDGYQKHRQSPPKAAPLDGSETEKGRRQSNPGTLGLAQEHHFGNKDQAAVDRDLSQLAEPPGGGKTRRRGTKRIMVPPTALGWNPSAAPGRPLMEMGSEAVMAESPGNLAVHWVPTKLRIASVTPAAQKPDKSSLRRKWDEVNRTIPQKRNKPSKVPAIFSKLNSISKVAKRLTPTMNSKGKSRRFRGVWERPPFREQVGTRKQRDYQGKPHPLQPREPKKGSEQARDHDSPPIEP